MAINQTRVDDGGGYAGEKAALSAALKRRQGGHGFSTAEATHGRDAGPTRGALSYDIKPLTRQASPSDTSPRKGGTGGSGSDTLAPNMGAIRTPRR